MKKNKTIKAATTLCIIALMSCSTDDQLAGDPIPMALTATVAPQTRSTVDNTWTGNEVIAVQATQIGDTEPSVKKYTVTDANTGALTISKEETTPFYFKSSTETKAVTAWYPYSAEYPESWTVEPDQSKDENYAASDLLKAEVPSATAGTTTLTFQHQTAKITLNVSFKDKTSQTISSIKIANIIPHKETATDAATAIQYNALVAPTKLDAKSPLFTIVTTDGNIYVYTLERDLTLDATKQYIYNVTLSYEGLSVTTTNSISWTTGDTGSGTVTME